MTNAVTDCVTDWPPCPHAGEHFNAERTRAQWPQLHGHDAEPLPADAAVLHAWALYHSGHLAAAAQTGLQAGPGGLPVAQAATAAHASLVEPRETTRLALYQHIHARACSHTAAAPASASAWYWQGWSLARQAQGIDVARALARGLGTQVRAALEAALALAPGHALAHAALAGFHAEVIDKVGPLVADMSYGARASTAHHHLHHALRLPPAAPVLLDCADALITLEGPARLAEATRLLEQAAALTPRDVPERLWVELARARLAL
ncbi:MAG: hypothetical protein Q4G71_09075 [Pseudomonadota bacterium]|nr:hypothetical protein [Pseudomonadota bacterium]